MGNRVNPLFIQKKDLNSDRLQLSFTGRPFSKAYLQERTGPPLLQSISSAEKGTAPSPKHIFSGEGDHPFSKTYLQQRREHGRAGKRLRKVPPSSSGYPARECGGDTPLKRPLKNGVYTPLNQSIQAFFHLYTGLNFTYTPYCNLIG